MNTRNLLVVLVLLLGLGLGYYIFAYRPQEIRARCLEVASYTSPVAKVWNIQRGGEKAIDDEIYKKCLGQ